MADDDFDTQWDDAPGGFDDWSADQQSDPFLAPAKPSAASADDRSYGFGSGSVASASASGSNALENDFHDEETGSYPSRNSNQVQR